MIVNSVTDISKQQKTSLTKFYQQIITCISLKSIKIYHQGKFISYKFNKRSVCFKFFFYLCEYCHNK